MNKDRIKTYFTDDITIMSAVGACIGAEPIKRQNKILRETLKYVAQRMQRVRDSLDQDAPDKHGAWPEDGVPGEITL